MTFKLKLPHAADILAQRPLYVNAKEKCALSAIFVADSVPGSIILYVKKIENDEAHYTLVSNAFHGDFGLVR